MRPHLKFAAVLALLAACGEGPLDPGDYTLEGTWVGRGFPFELFLALEQDGDNRVTGTGEVRSLQEILETVVVPGDPPGLDTVRIDTVTTDTVRFEVGGRWDYPRFELRLTADGYAGAEYAGTYDSADSIGGALSGSGFPSTPIGIVRQPVPED
ncbi:MAG TPA: hypothetical protein VFR37_02735 [Longimicrobium sp.]|nr:hypothetical protein [Longimicrobium sp.]